MNRLPSLVIVTMILLSPLSGHTKADDNNSILIRIVDQNNQPVESQELDWWLDDLTQKATLRCEQHSCSEWLIEEKFGTSSKLNFLVSKVRDDDKDCWDWFIGHAVIQPDQKELTITLSYSETVCK